MQFIRRLQAGLIGVMALAIIAHSALAAGYAQTNLVSDGLVPAITVDPTLKNPWGIALGRYVKLASNHESENGRISNGRPFHFKVGA